MQLTDPVCHMTIDSEQAAAGEPGSGRLVISKSCRERKADDHDAHGSHSH